MDYYPENKVSDYKTHLPKELVFTGPQWHVGLCEVFYPTSWYNVDSNDFWVYFRRGDVSVMTTLPGGFYEHESGVVKQLLEAMKQDFEEKNKQLISDKTINKEEEFLFDMTYNTQTQLCTFHIAQNRSDSETSTNGFTTTIPYLTFRISERLANMLGFLQREFHEAGIYTSDRVVDIDTITAIYVYCDIIQYRTVGDSLAPLLSIIPVEGKSGARVSKRYETIQYHPILNRNISDIRITLRDDRGALVKFRKGKIILTLHFKQAQLGVL